MAIRSNKVRDDSAQSGFTLIEILIVIVVLGIIAAVVVFALGGVNAQAAVAACKADATTVQTAVTAYEAQNDGGYPTSTASLTGGSTTYLQSWPSSPNYAISLVNGTVMIATSGNPTALAYGSVSACSGAGSSSPTTTAPPASTTTTVPPTTTTTTAVSNGVTASAGPTIYGTSAVNYGGQDAITLNNPAPMTMLTITINVAQTPSVTYNTEFNNFWGQWGTETYSISGGYITYTYTLTSGPTIAGSNWNFTAQYADQGQAHYTSGDTWSVVSKSGGISSTLSGTF